VELLTEYLLRIPHGIERDLTRYTAFAVGVWLVLWITLGNLLAHRKIRESWPERQQLVSEFLHSLRSIAIFSVGSSIPWLLWRLDLLPWQEVNDRMTGASWFWGTVAVQILVHDAYFYWVHRWMHQPRRFRLYHRRHHRSNNPSPFTAYSFDLREAAMMILFIVLWEFLLPNANGATGVFILIQLGKNTLAHSGFELMPATRDGKPLLDFMTTTVHHDLHHRRAGTNFGLYFTWWDRWCGTEDPLYHQEFRRVVSQRRGAVTAPSLPA
jgi:sterol desaturase/sphingolipid hydroxylase (fatty acid hydroxylase superfamily)